MDETTKGHEGVPTYNGILQFHSETGTEGGYWAMQDENFMGLVDERTMNTYRCPKCGRIWDRTRDAEEPKSSFTYYRPARTVDGENHYGGYYGSDVPIEGGQTKFGDEEDGSFNDEWTKRSNATSLECYENGHGEWELANPDGVWSYEGLHVLKDGDKLTVYADETKSEVRWSGTIELIPQPLFTTDVANLWVHSLPNVPEMTVDEWGEMFFKQLPCTLETT